MPPNTDPEEWTNEEWVDREFIDYALQSHERKSLDAIKNNLVQGAYTSAQDCRDHMELLEHFSNKLKDIINNEHSIGKVNWDVERAYKEVKALYAQLSAVYERLRG